MITYLVNVFDEEYIIEQNGTIETECGSLSEKDLFTIVNLAEKLAMKCLSLISDEQDTIFNTYQAKQLKKEIDILRAYQEISPEALDVIQKGADKTAQEEFMYLKFYKQPVLFTPSKKV